MAGDQHVLGDAVRVADPDNPVTIEGLPVRNANEAAGDLLLRWIAC